VSGIGTIEVELHWSPPEAEDVQMYLFAGLPDRIINY